MSTTVRDSFVSYLSCRTRSNVARVMTGSNEFGKVAGGLKVGQCVWMNTSGEMISLAVPNTTQAHVERVAQEIEGDAVGYDYDEVAEIVPVEITAGPPVNVVSDAVKIKMVRDLMANCAGRTAIIKQVWGVTGGRGFIAAGNELDQIMAGIARRSVALDS